MVTRWKRKTIKKENLIGNKMKEEDNKESLIGNEMEEEDNKGEFNW